MVTKSIYDNISITEEKDSEIKITGKIQGGVIPLYRTRALKEIGSSVEIHGFRKGHIPDHVLSKRVGEEKVLSHIAELALQDAYPQIVEEHKIKAIGRPKVTITKLAPGNPIEFSIETAILPEVTLPDYKKISAEVLEKQEIILVTKEDVDSVIEKILKHKTKEDTQKNGADKNSEKSNQNKLTLTDEIVKTLGDFKNVEDFKKKLKENLKIEKEYKVKEKTRGEIGEKIIEKTVVTLPRVLVESELDKMVAQLKSDVERMGLKFEEYTKNIKKTEEDIRKGFELDAQKRAKLQLIINNIAVIEEINISEDEMKKESEHILKHHKDADPNRVAIYVETILTNEKVFQLLEDDKIIK